ncbi:BatD family protein [Shimia aestuarii]|uniref:Oxygen tolerance n=1 Tax=Shimia aestuarii TaxID=254406 RepID=A0A1I4RMX8_9RHOB|nr:BatD family protein [Shimia aestuarii]SFM53549.1 Oxygen tolerance [Shimia aestuarii]
MMRLLLAFVFSFCTTIAMAQGTPVLEIELSDTETLPGQPLTLRITVLVPTWMPEPPVWPSFEAPNLMVRLPERASTSTSRRIDGETWSGISRRYQITPMVPGTVRLPAQTLTVVYADPPNAAPLRAELAIEARNITGILPKGAEGLDPFIAARALRLTQTIEGTSEGLQAGDSFSRVITAETEGLSGIFLPELTPDAVLSGVRAYPETPEVSDKDNRGKVTGTRRETTVYMAEGGVDGTLLGVSLDWYNIASGKVETATTDPIPVSATAPPAPPEPRDWRRIGALGVVAALAGLLVTWLIRRLTPPLRRWRAAHRQRYLDSARFAWRHLQEARRQRDLGATRAAYDLWRARSPVQDAGLHTRIEAAFADIGAARYGARPDAREERYWQSLSGLFHLARRVSPRAPKTGALPALNPTAPRHH